jgi:hypothetical protein
MESSGFVGAGAATVLLLVGPEGDFTKEELESLADAGANMVGLGTNRLRVETAALALLNGCALAWDALTPARLEQSPDNFDEAGAGRNEERSAEASDVTPTQQELAHAA